jgi:hypothetical protein
MARSHATAACAVADRQEKVASDLGGVLRRPILLPSGAGPWRWSSALMQRPYQAAPQSLRSPAEIDRFEQFLTLLFLATCLRIRG